MSLSVSQKMHLKSQLPSPIFINSNLWTFEWCLSLPFINYFSLECKAVYLRLEENDWSVTDQLHRSMAVSAIFNAKNVLFCQFIYKIYKQFEGWRLSPCSLSILYNSVECQWEDMNLPMYFLLHWVLLKYFLPGDWLSITMTLT